MKEKYYDSDTIDFYAKKFVEILIPYKKKDIKVNPEKVCLIVTDMQRYFVDEISHAYIPSVSAIIPRIKRLINVFQNRFLPIILTQHINTKKNAKQMAKWWDNLITADNPLSEIIDDLKIENVKIIIKSQYDAFYETELHDYLKKKNITQVVITGVMTHLCCETTARSAFMRGYDVFFVIDGTATYNRDLHISSLLNLTHGFAKPVLTEEIVIAISG